MKRIPSFSIDHTRLKKGLYPSRQDDDVMTWDVRMKEPNHGDYLSQPALHTIEHLFATWARNSEFRDSVIYVGPMGCRTGFYIILRDSVSRADAIRLVRDSFRFIADYSGEIPGAKASECGNCIDHDLLGARRVARELLPVLEGWTEDRLEYGV